MISVRVEAGGGYDVRIGPGILPQIGEALKTLFPQARKAHIVTDFHVKERYLEPVDKALETAGFQVGLSVLVPGEEAKSGAVYLTLLENLRESHMSRSDVLVALGGGVIGDVAGFAAATYLRGLPFIQVPTTLLAMVDSSVGGKVAINLPRGKNLAGTFYQPALVLCDTRLLDTLPEAVFRDGLAEVIKYGMLDSAKLLEQLSDGALADRLESVIAQCLSIKRDLVQRDEFDRGQRMLLNFGHTIGHAIERLSGYTVSHGAAVAIGMAVDTRAALRRGLCPPECLAVLEKLLFRFGLPSRTSYTAEAIYNAALGDKKRRGGEITNVLPRALGKCELMNMPTASLLDWIEMGLEP